MKSFIKDLVLGTLLAFVILAVLALAFGLIGG